MRPRTEQRKIAYLIGWHWHEVGIEVIERLRNRGASGPAAVSQVYRELACENWNVRRTMHSYEAYYG